MTSNWSSATNVMTSSSRRRVPDVPQDVVEDHLNDPNYDLHVPDHRAAFSSSVELGGHDFKKDSLDTANSETHLLRSAGLSTDGGWSRPAPDFEDESPYPEVRATVSSVDDPSMPVNTFRMWFLGIFFSILIPGLNQFFSMRSPSILITGIVVQLAALPLGKALAWLLPTTQFHTLGWQWSFNPGPFNLKEHVVITVMANTVIFGAYATDIIATQKVFYHQHLRYSYEILLTLSIQLFGFSFGGFMQKLVVRPASMIWPGALVNAALFNTLHKKFNTYERGHMSRVKFFGIVLVCSAVYYWIPGYLFTALSVFNWVCWIRPNDVVLNSLFGTITGLGMGVATFDWAQISFIGSPLVTPWWAQANTAASLVICFWIIAPVIYYTNTFLTQFLPMSAFSAFDNTGNPYSPSQIITNGQFDTAKYHAYSPVYVSATLAVAYGASFAATGALIMHTFLWYSRDIMRRFRSTFKAERDVHARLRQAYAPVPHIWFTLLGGTSFIMLIIAVEIYPTQVPIWGVIVAVSLSALLVIPLTMITAITNQTIALPTIYEMIAGYLLPGRPVANMIFKAIAHTGTTQAIVFSGNSKLGWYMKIPPRTLFTAQLLAVVVSCFVVTSLQDWMFAHIEDICMLGQKNGFSCPATQTFANASLIWGGIGPQRLFGPGTMYTSLLFFFPIGFFLPLPFYLLARRYPFSVFRYVNFPVFFDTVTFIPVATGLNYASWAVTGFIFNYVLRRYKFRWWMRYNYILSAGLDAGVAVGFLMVFFAVQLPRGGISLNWLGNTIWQNTADAKGTPLRTVGMGQTFGPGEWK